MRRCEVCGRYGGHAYGCPEGNDGLNIKGAKCSCCDYPIGDMDYIENDNGDQMHLFCADTLTIRELLEWLNIDIKNTGEVFIDD